MLTAHTAVHPEQHAGLKIIPNCWQPCHPAVCNTAGRRRPQHPHALWPHGCAGPRERAARGQPARCARLLCMLGNNPCVVCADGMVPLRAKSMLYACIYTSQTEIACMPMSYCMCAQPAERPGPMASRARATTCARSSTAWASPTRRSWPCRVSLARPHAA